MRLPPSRESHIPLVPRLDGMHEDGRFSTMRPRRSPRSTPPAAPFNVIDVSYIFGRRALTPKKGLPLLLADAPMRLRDEVRAPDVPRGGNAACDGDVPRELEEAYFPSKPLLPSSSAPSWTRIILDKRKNLRILRNRERQCWRRIRGKGRLSRGDDASLADNVRGCAFDVHIEVEWDEGGGETQGSRRKASKSGKNVQGGERKQALAGETKTDSRRQEEVFT
ncbi:hypothetical protein R3P38DRAFT_3230456 [Favolaschia claudopus]|uniref:Uncharacterized protein n=1 Tax=Favolaschia claudopus TaxID=2862362 RepID=A0AAV9ZMQ4_9AGAR